MPRRNYIHKSEYKKQKRKLENKTKLFAKRMNDELVLGKKSSDLKKHENK